MVKLPPQGLAGVSRGHATLLLKVPLVIAKDKAEITKEACGANPLSLTNIKLLLSYVEQAQLPVLLMATGVLRAKVSKLVSQNVTNMAQAARKTSSENHRLF
eukprot:gnl/MRDRNA2_/MRDRNA2_64811_c0_seq1.p1 gnl/MRDRNA2_/MRDRNA2_64811_c0~~gnl/MRDRNA2_/MRDRNA2_64811_c0_seq1.p1  ORF type:complete len:102 (+),score=9.10 gnl/MRDRNA2_/MRDRNA2_64811_c0_seq1:161-466(+)